MVSCTRQAVIIFSYSSVLNVDTFVDWHINLELVYIMFVSEVVVFIFLVCKVNSSTHWIVTEDGKIKQQVYYI